MVIGLLATQDCPHSLADFFQRFSSRLGSTYVDCGVRPRVGGRNLTPTLQNGQYIEVVCLLDHPATNQTSWGKEVSQKAQKGRSWLTGFFVTKDISKVKERFGRRATDGHRTRPDQSNLKWKLIGVSIITDSHQFSFSIQRIAIDYRSQDGKGAAAIETICVR